MFAPTLLITVALIWLLVTARSAKAAHAIKPAARREGGAVAHTARQPKRRGRNLRRGVAGIGDAVAMRPTPLMS